MDLSNALRSMIVDIDRQILEVTKLAAEEYHDVRPSELKTADGNFLLTPLLAAKAQCLHGLALLKTNK